MRAYRLAPDSFDTYLAVVRAYLELPPSLPRVDAAERLKSLPPPPAHLSAQEHFVLGLLFASRGAYVEAIPHFEKAAEADPEEERIHNFLASAYRAVGEMDKAREEEKIFRKLSITGELRRLKFKQKQAPL